ncbi:DUF222 domain-containing protein [Nocardia sp. NPDC004860]|uniref:HNH endonuclease signature motif containing protein n=1 Tax=Nocardia sp. NPDC004860 TaxID=3154557 RepID=UPI0033B221D7
MNSKEATLDTCGIAELATAVETLSNSILHGNLDQFTDSEVVELMRKLETCKRQLSALDSRLVIETSDRSLPQQNGDNDLVPFLRHTLGLSRYDASVRVKIAGACGEFFDRTGQPCTATLPATAKAFETAAISRDQVRGIVEIMTHLPSDIPTQARAEAEELLVAFCHTESPDDLPKIGREILARLDPNGTVISDADRRHRRGIMIGRPGVDGMSKMEGWLTPGLRASLDAILAKFARPGMCNIDDAEILTATARIDSKVLEAAARRDRRDAAQRTHDALYALLQPDINIGQAGVNATKPRASAAELDVNTAMLGISPAELAVNTATLGISPAELDVNTATLGISPAELAVSTATLGISPTELAVSTGTLGISPTELALNTVKLGISAAELGSHRGMRVQPVLTMSLADVERGAGMATTSTGGHVTIHEALVLAQGTRPVLAVLDANEIPVYLGRCKRLATSAQRLALIARDKGCTRPGCDAPASMCAAHHVTDWAAGGPTDLNNLTLACDHCHALVNNSPDGWKTIVMGQDSPHPGRCAWIAPKHIDPTRTPQVNERHHMAERVAARIESGCREWSSRVA